MKVGNVHQKRDEGARQSRGQKTDGRREVCGTESARAVVTLPNTVLWNRPMDCRASLAPPRWERKYW